jgi:uncharacterized protein YbbC (DUF1343 family)
MQSIYWYAGNCLFEGTVLSEGRGTEHPFCIIGHPALPDTLFSFTPVSREGAKDPKLKNQLCHGWNLTNLTPQLVQSNRLPLQYLLQAYRLFPNKDSFFLQPKTGINKDFFFHKLAGNNVLMQQIKSGLSEADIRQSWLPGITAFKAIRKKYLLYTDFE